MYSIANYYFTVCNCKITKLFIYGSQKVDFISFQTDAFVMMQYINLKNVMNFFICKLAIGPFSLAQSQYNITRCVKVLYIVCSYWFSSQLYIYNIQIHYIVYSYIAMYISLSLLCSEFCFPKKCSCVILTYHYLLFPYYSFTLIFQVASYILTSREIRT